MNTTFPRLINKPRFISPREKLITRQREPTLSSSSCDTRRLCKVSDTQTRLGVSFIVWGVEEFHLHGCVDQLSTMPQESMMGCCKAKGGWTTAPAGRQGLGNHMEEKYGRGVDTWCRHDMRRLMIVWNVEKQNCFCHTVFHVIGYVSGHFTTSVYSALWQVQFPVFLLIVFNNQKTRIF